MELWINPDCSKCRIAMSALDQAGVTYTVRRYLDAPPTTSEIESVLERLGLQPWDIVRMTEPVAFQIGLDHLERSPQTRSVWIEAMAAHPIVIQRPIITTDDGAAYIGRESDVLDAVVNSVDR